jgi:hypothetical protein
MELLLPVAVKLFPNMLPSTFEDKFAAVCYIDDFHEAFFFTNLIHDHRKRSSANYCVSD